MRLKIQHLGDIAGDSDSADIGIIDVEFATTREHKRSVENDSSNEARTVFPTAAVGMVVNLDG
jgi:hypothetical protein